MLKLCFSWDSLVYTDVSMYVFENARLHARASLDMAASQDAHVVRLKIEKTVCQIAPTNTREKNRPYHISHARMFSNRCLIFWDCVNVNFQHSARVCFLPRNLGRPQAMRHHALMTQAVEFIGKWTTHDYASSTSKTERSR